jgi:hypothetical protein
MYNQQIKQSGQSASTIRTYKTAPLPFMGQKRRFINKFKEVLRQYREDAVYVDLFGGSGLLSHIVKETYPGATVVYNDYDNYRARLEAIPTTNKLLSQIRAVVGKAPKDKRLDEAVKTQILAIVRAETGFVDYITLSSSLLFSMKYVTSFEALEKETFYNVVKQGDYNADGYLQGVQVVSRDFKALYDSYSSYSNVVFMVDPPYLSTEVSPYKNYWKLSDYLDVLTVLQGGKYFYFTSNKSHIVELCEWMTTQSSYVNPFSAATVTSHNVQLNYTSSYTDIMIYKV